MTPTSGEPSANLPSDGTRNSFGTFYAALDAFTQQSKQNRRPTRRQTLAPAWNLAPGDSIASSVAPPPEPLPAAPSLRFVSCEPDHPSFEEAKMLDMMDRARLWAEEEYQRQKQYLEYVLDEVEMIDDEQVGHEFLLIAKKLRGQLILTQAALPGVLDNVELPQAPGTAATRLLALQLVLDWQIRCQLLQLTALITHIRASNQSTELIRAVRSLREFGRVMDT